MAYAINKDSLFYPISALNPIAEEPTSTECTTQRVDRVAQKAFLKVKSYTPQEKRRVNHSFKKRRIEYISGGSFGAVYRLKDAHAHPNMRLIEKVQRASDTAFRELSTHQYFLQNGVPNIPNLFEVHKPENDDEDLNVHIVMQDAGEDIHKKYIGSKRLPEIGNLKVWIKRWLQTLSAMHKLGYLHADIKPANLTEKFMIDLGLSFEIDDDPYFRGGTPFYVPPEMAKHEALTSKADSFSLGISLLEIMTRTKLLERTDYISKGCFSWDKVSASYESLPQEEISERVRTRILKKYKKNAETEELIRLVQQLLQKDPEKRISSTEALAHPLFSTLVKPRVAPVVQSSPVISTRDQVRKVFASGRNTEALPWEQREAMELWNKVRPSVNQQREITSIDVLVGSSATSTRSVSKIHQVIRAIFQGIKKLFILIGYVSILPAAIYHSHKNCRSDDAAHDGYAQMA